MPRELKSECSFLVPIRYNDGREVEPEVFVTIQKVLDRQFDGFRIAGPPTDGSWRGFRETTLEIVVSVAPLRVIEVRQVVIAIGQHLGQSQMYFKVTPPSVELIDIEETTASLASLLGPIERREA